MTAPIALVLGLLVLAIFLFASEKFSVDIITIFLLIILTATCILTPEEAFAGFGSDFVVTLVSIYIISGALQRSGVLDYFGARLVKASKLSAQRLTFYVMVLSGATSAFMNNTTTTAVYLPPVLSVARRMKLSPSKILMPLAYASILGGTVTMIGTSTNIAVNGYLAKNGFGHFNLFDIFPIGIILFITGLIYVLVIGRKLLPDIKEDNITEEILLRKYVTEIHILPNSRLIGEHVFDSTLSRMGFRILNVIRGESNFIPDSTSVIHPNDMLIVEGAIEHLVKVKETSGIEIRADALVSKEMQSGNIKLAEILVTGQSEFVGKSVKKFNFRQKYNLVVVAINRAGQTLTEKIGSTELQLGDILLVQGLADKIDYLQQNRSIIVIEDFRPELYKMKKGIYTLIIFIAAVVCSSLGVLPLSVAFMSAAFLTIVFRIVSVTNAYEHINFQLLIMIAGMSAFGTALVKSGASVYLASHITSVFGSLGNQWLLAG
ncbi:MAG TPA: SLC13 family permease, partial [Bacteroidia bacterium]|nr:SLC13 family permease [Bacteroidia bacterium]